jgi:hypothetical protein
MGSDFGVDNILCGAAKHYTQMNKNLSKLNHKTQKSNKMISLYSNHASISPCAIHTKQSFTHLNLKSSVSNMSAEERQQDEWYKHKLIVVISDLFPQFWVFGQSPESDPRKRKRDIKSNAQLRLRCEKHLKSSRANI